jgi:hypothetical protein
MVPSSTELWMGRVAAADVRAQDAKVLEELWDGATLILARASDPFDTVTSLAVPAAHTQLAVLPVPAPPILALPPDEVRARSLLPFLALGGVLLALVGFGVWFVRSQQSDPTPAVPVVAPTPAQPGAAAPPAVSGGPTTPLAAPTLAPSVLLVQATPDEEAAWRGLLAKLDSVWGVDWPASIGLLQAFHSQYPPRASATEKLYAGLIEYGRALRDAGVTSAAADEFRAGGPPGAATP